MEFINHFGKTKEGKIIIFDVFTFNSFFSLLLNEGFDHEDALMFILAEGELNAIVFQKCIHNKAYLKLKAKELDFQVAGRRSVLHQTALSFINRA